MTALYLERYLNYGLTRGGAAIGQADHRHRPDRRRSVALQSPPPRCSPSGSARAFATPAASPSSFRSIRSRRPASGPTAGARSQSGLSGTGRGAVRLSARWRGADDRLRQDDAGLPDGGGHRQHSRRSRSRSGRCSTAGTRASAPAPARSSGRRASCSPPARSTSKGFIELVASSAPSTASATRWAPRRR